MSDLTRGSGVQNSVLQITVYGQPAPQGSKSFKGMSKSGHAILTESSKAVKPWREAVKWAVIGAMSRPDHMPDRATIRGPVRMEIVFTMPKPKSAPKRRKTWPDRQPDIDKLCRSSLDALVMAGAIEDDARVVHLTASKVFPGEGPDSLGLPGCLIRITSAEEGLF